MKAAPRGGFLPNNGAGERADAKLSSGAAAVSQCPYIISSGFCPGVLACAKNGLFESSAASLEKTAPSAPFPFFIELNDIFEGHFYHTPQNDHFTERAAECPRAKMFFDAVACEQPMPCVLPFTAPAGRKSMITPRIIFEIKRSNVFERRLSGVRSFRFCVTPR